MRPKRHKQAAWFDNTGRRLRGLQGRPAWPGCDSSVTGVHPESETRMRWHFSSQRAATTPQTGRAESDVFDMSKSPAE